MAVKLARPINYRSAASITALDFQNIMQDLKVRKDFAVAISGDPDSLALALLSEQYAKDATAADKIISGMSEMWFNMIID